MSNLTSSQSAAPIERMKKIWARILDHEEFGENDSFFDVGGHSLLTMELAVEIQNEFGIDIPVESIFDYSTIAGLCALISRRTTSGHH